MMKNHEHTPTYVADGVQYPFNDLYGYPDSFLRARLNSAYVLGAGSLPARHRGIVLDIGSWHGHGIDTISSTLQSEQIVSSDMDISVLQHQNMVLKPKMLL